MENPWVVAVLFPTSRVTLSSLCTVILSGEKPAPAPTVAALMERTTSAWPPQPVRRSEEHTSELQSRFDLVCRLLLEKKHTLVFRDIDDPDATSAGGQFSEIGHRLECEFRSNHARTSRLALDHPLRRDGGWDPRIVDT